MLYFLFKYSFTKPTSLLMYKNYKLILFLGAAIIFLYMSVGKYEEFSIKKSISACVIAKSKLKKDMSPQEARKVCEVEIKQNK